MATTLRFAVEDVRRVVEHVRASSTHRSHFATGERKPFVAFVKDEGVYLMSSGEPRDIIDEETRLSFAAYAKGYNPYTGGRGEVHAKATAAVGGDDFAEALPVEIFEGALAAPHVVGITVHVTRTSMRVGVLTKRSKG